MVTVTLTGKGEMRAVRIDPDMVKPGEAEMIEDLVVAAHQDARAKVEAAVQERMQEVPAVHLLVVATPRLVLGLLHTA